MTVSTYMKSLLMLPLFVTAGVASSAQLKSSFMCEVTVKDARGHSIDYYQLPLNTKAPINSASLEQVYKAAVVKKFKVKDVERARCFAIDEAHPEMSLASNLRAVAEMKTKGWNKIEFKIKH